MSRHVRHRRRSSGTFAIALTVAALTLAACGGAGSDETNTDGAGVEEDIEAEPDPAEQAAALSAVFAGATPLDGDTTFDGASLAGTDSVLWFWAPWCTICRAEAPEIAEIAEQYGSEVRIVGVPGRGELEAMRSFVDDTGTGSITHLADTDGDIWSAFDVFGQPAFAFVDDSGTVDVFVGSLGGNGLTERIDELTSN